MKKTSRLIVWALFCLGAALCAACAPDMAERTVTLNHTALEMKVGEEQKLELSDGGIVVLQGVEWKTDTAAVASVENGTVAAKGAGRANITALYRGNTCECAVSVTAVQSVALSRTELYLVVGGSAALTLEKDGTALTEGVAWSSSDESVAAVKDGAVTALAPGETVISALCEGERYSCAVTVYASPAGTYYSRVQVAEMDDAVFEFDLIIAADGTYRYSRRDSGSADGGNFIAGETVSEGTWAFGSGGILTFRFTGGTMEMKVSASGLLMSVGEIPTGGMESELTFERTER